MTVIAALWGWTCFELIIAPTYLTHGTSDLWYSLFVFNSTEPYNVFSWVTSIFSHGSFTHLFVNTVVLYSFGIPLERRLGGQRFLGLFFAAAFVATAAQLAGAVIANETMYMAGASGAVAGLIGALSVYRPHAKALLFFVVPTPMWALAGLLIGGSLGLVLLNGVGAFGVAHLAHAGGAVAGVLTAYVTPPPAPDAPSGDDE